MNILLSGEYYAMVSVQYSGLLGARNTIQEDFNWVIGLEFIGKGEIMNFEVVFISGIVFIFEVVIIFRVALSFGFIFIIRVVIVFEVFWILEVVFLNHPF